MLCCGKERKSRFCPECGKFTGPTPASEVLRGLLDYCRERETVRAEAAGRYRQAAANPPGPYYQARPDRIQFLGDRAAIEAGTWKARGDALAALLEEGDI